MALIGQARAKLGASFPLIGVTAGGTVKPDGSTVGRAAVASLEPNHTHVVLVPGARWGDESSWLADVASWVAGDAPSVTVVVNGGEVTVGDAERSVAAGRCWWSPEAVAPLMSWPRPCRSQARTSGREAVRVGTGGGG